MSNPYLFNVNVRGTQEVTIEADTPEEAINYLERLVNHEDWKVEEETDVYYDSVDDWKAYPSDNQIDREYLLSEITQGSEDE